MTPVDLGPETTGPEFDPANPERPKHEKLDDSLRDKPNAGRVNPTDVGKDNRDRRTEDSDNAGRAD